MKNFYKIFLVLAIVISACENQDIEFPDFEYTTVYFAYQTPVRTIVLGQDYVFDNSLDNEGKCLIMATLGGVYENTTDRIINVSVDNSLCDNLLFPEDSVEVRAMPSAYYNMPADMQIVIPSGKVIGGIEVELTDAFFADSLSLTNNYVIPLVMESVENADSILRGVAVTDSPDKRVTDDWETVPKDYVLYAVKYKNPYDARYLRRGQKVATGKNGNSDLNITVTYIEKYIEENEVCTAVSSSLNEVSINLSALNADETKTPFTIFLDFDDNDNCTVNNSPSESYSVTGAGQYVRNGDMWGDKERDAIYLNYEIDFGTSVHAFIDTLVLRDRNSALETFIPIVINE